MVKNSAIVDGVLAEFEPLTRIPRPSGHEKAVSDYLKKYLTDAGFTVVQDKVNNIIADKPATPGYEQAPRTILQGHMDMVCVAEEGVKFDPQHDAIKLHRTDEYLEAVGTSLGGDDGIGVAIGSYIMKHAREHGPLRLIVTVDEERGMTGSINLDGKYVKDAQFLINCDSENYDELTVGSAGSVHIDFSRKFTRVPAEGKQAWQLSLKGLKGGHSGERIGDGRGNAIRTLAQLLQGLEKQGHVELTSFTGGKAPNAIPDAAAATFVTDMPCADLQAGIKAEKERFHAICGGVDPEITLELTALKETPASVLQADDANRLLTLLTVLHTGVYAMSTVIPGLIETSANLGVLQMDEDEVRVQFFPRSAIDAKLDEFVAMAGELAELTGFTLHASDKAPGWKENKNSRLAKIMAETFEEQNGKPMKVETIHAGLECGYHFMRNPQLDMVSIGVTTVDIHSPNEKVMLATIEPQVKLIETTLQKIAKLK